MVMYNKVQGSPNLSFSLSQRPQGMAMSASKFYNLKSGPIWKISEDEYKIIGGDPVLLTMDLTTKNALLNKTTNVQSLLMPTSIKKIPPN